MSSAEGLAEQKGTGSRNARSEEACVKCAYKSGIDPPNAQELQASGAYAYMCERG